LLVTRTHQQLPFVTAATFQCRTAAMATAILSPSLLNFNDYWVVLARCCCVAAVAMPGE